MDGNLRRSHTSDDQLPEGRGRTRSPYNMIASNRNHPASHNLAQQTASPGEDEIIVDAGLWVIFNRRLLAAIIRKL